MVRVLSILLLLFSLSACIPISIGEYAPAPSPDARDPTTAVDISNASDTPITEDAPTDTAPVETREATVIGVAATQASPATPAPRSTAIRPLPPTPVVPITFSIIPTMTKQIGDRLTMNWKAAGEEADICPVDGTGPLINLCVKVPLTGSRTVTIDASQMGYMGYTLRVSKNRVLQFVTVSVALQCQGLRDWFIPHPPVRCPQAAALNTDAAAQRFEHGLMVWLAQPNTFYVFFDADSAPRYVEFASHVNLRPDASPDNRVGGAPEGFVEPVNSFGMLWRGEIEGFSNLRDRLGWATQLEVNYTSTYQCATPAHPRSWNCYLRRPDGRTVLLYPDSTAQAHFVWREW